MIHRNRCLPTLIVVVLASLSVMGLAGSALGSHQSIYADFETEFSPDSISGSGGKLSKVVNPIPEKFKVFLPPGAVKATMIIYGQQGKVYGAASRVDNEPQCTYDLTLSNAEAELLPWDAPKSGSLTQMRSRDYQMNNADGQIEVLDWGWGTTPLTGEGHWIYVKMLRYELGYLELNFTVNVDEDAYTTWYNSATFTSGQPPATSAGPTGGTCEDEWSEGPGDTPDPDPDPVDNTPDISVSITNPSNGDTVQGTIEFRISTYSESQTRSVASVRYAVDGSVVGSTVTSSPFSLSFDTTTLSDGSHTLTATVTDNTGETSTSGTLTFSVANSTVADSQDPTVSVTSPASGATISGQTTMTASASDNVGVSGVQFKVDGQNSGAEDVSSPYSVSLDTTALTDGSHVITATARDAAGNTATSANVTVTVNNSGSVIDPDQVFTAQTFPIAQIEIVSASDPITIAPVLQFPGGLTGVYDCYAAFIKDGELFLAEEHISGEPFFEKFRDGDLAKTYGQKSFSGETQWAPTVFGALPAPKLEVVKRRGILFFVALAPAGGVPEGVIFTFSD